MLDNIIVSKRRWTGKAMYCVVHSYEMSKMGKSMKIESRFMVAQGVGDEEMETNC